MLVPFNSSPWRTPRRQRGLPRSRVYGLLRRGEVRVNGGRVKPAHRLAAGDQVRIPPVRLKQTEPIATGQRTLHQLTAAACRILFSCFYLP